MITKSLNAIPARAMLKAVSGGNNSSYHMREKINTALKEAVKAQDKRRMSTLRLISAAIKDRDIAARTKDHSEGVSDAELLDILSKMIKQRRDAISMYEEAGRLELAAQEQEEIAIIEDFLPRQLAEDEIRNACETAVNTTGARSLKDMGRVMGALKGEYAGQMDFGKASAVIKGLLG